MLSTREKERAKELLSKTLAAVKKGASLHVLPHRFKPDGVPELGDEDEAREEEAPEFILPDDEAADGLDSTGAGIERMLLPDNEWETLGKYCLQHGVRQGHLEAMYKRFQRSIDGTQHPDFTTKAMFTISVDFLANELYATAGEFAFQMLLQTWYLQRKKSLSPPPDRRSINFARLVILSCDLCRMGDFELLEAYVASVLQRLDKYAPVREKKAAKTRAKGATTSGMYAEGPGEGGQVASAAAAPAAEDKPQRQAKLDLDVQLNVELVSSIVTLSHRDVTKEVMFLRDKLLDTAQSSDEADPAAPKYITARELIRFAFLHPPLLFPLFECQRMLRKRFCGLQYWLRRRSSAEERGVSMKGLFSLPNTLGDLFDRIDWQEGAWTFAVGYALIDALLAKEKAPSSEPPEQAADEEGSGPAVAEGVVSSSPSEWDERLSQLVMNTLPPAWYMPGGKVVGYARHAGGRQRALASARALAMLTSRAGKASGHLLGSMFSGQAQKLKAALTYEGLGGALSPSAMATRLRSPGRTRPLSPEGGHSQTPREGSKTLPKGGTSPDALLEPGLSPDSPLPRANKEQKAFIVRDAVETMDIESFSPAQVQGEEEGRGESSAEPLEAPHRGRAGVAGVPLLFPQDQPPAPSTGMASGLRSDRSETTLHSAGDATARQRSREGGRRAKGLGKFVCAMCLAKSSTRAMCKRCSRNACSALKDRYGSRRCKVMLRRYGSSFGICEIDLLEQEEEWLKEWQRLLDLDTGRYFYFNQYFDTAVWEGDFAFTEEELWSVSAKKGPKRRLKVNIGGPGKAVGSAARLPGGQSTGGGILATSREGLSRELSPTRAPPLNEGGDGARPAVVLDAHKRLHNKWLTSVAALQEESGGGADEAGEYSDLDATVPAADWEFTGQQPHSPTRGKIPSLTASLKKLFL